MSGSETQSKTLQPEVVKLPLKGYHVPLDIKPSGHEMTIEGMGNGRYRIHGPKRQPKQK